MATVVRAVDVDVPVHTAYRQWMRFEEFPRSMEGVREVRRLDVDRLYWIGVLGGHPVEREVRIVERRPGERISWWAADGSDETTVVSVRRRGEDSALVTVRVDYEPLTVLERAGDVLGVVGRRVEADLRRFKRLVERRGVESGIWELVRTRDTRDRRVPGDDARMRTGRGAG